MKIRAILGISLLGFLFGGIFPGACPAALGQSNDLEIKIPGQQHDQVGYVHRDDGREFHWFVIRAGRSTIVRNLHPGSYTVSLLCQRPQQEEALRVELTTGRVTATFRGSGGGLHSESGLLDLVPGEGMVGFNTCELETILTPILLASHSFTATTAQISTAILRSSGRKIRGNRSKPVVEPETPVEAWLTELTRISMILGRIHYAQQIDKLVEDQVKLWQNGKVRVEPERLLDGNLFLGVLTASVEPPQLEPNDSAIITVKYLSSHQIPSATKFSSYFLEVFHESQISRDSHISINPTRYGPQEIVPTVEADQWNFEAKTATDFKGSSIVLRYKLLKKDKAGQLKEIRSGQFPEPIRISVKPKPSCLEWIELIVRKVGGFIGWIIATLVGIYELRKYIKKRV